MDKRSDCEKKHYKILPSMINLLFTFSLLFSACSTSDMKPGNTQLDVAADSAKILIVYLSRTNNTKAVAEMIHEKVGGKLTALELEKPYPENYRANVSQVVKENETGFLPPLKTSIDSMEKYNIVFIGFPTWAMKIPPPIKSFLHQYDLRGKIVIPFNTNAGYGVGSGFETVKELCPGSTVLQGFSTTGGIERDGIFFVMEGEKKKQVQEEVTKWLKILKVIK